MRMIEESCARMKPISIFKSHKLILYQRSSFFRQKLESANNVFEISLPNIPVESFKIIIKYIYTGVISFENVENSTIFDLLISSDKLDFDELVEYIIQTYLIDNNASWLRLNFAQVHNTSFEVDNDLQVEEIEIWEKVIQWGKAQTQDLPSVLEQWTDENFMTLKTTLHNCLPLIRYLQIPVNDILTKVKPYRRILGQDLWDDITAKFMTSDAVITSNILPARKKLSIQLPTRETSIESCIVNEEHAAEISSWIDRYSSPYDVTKTPYKLLLRGSRDDFTVGSFHRLCNNIPRTVVIIKVDGTNEILGGYNPLVWQSSSSTGYLKTADSFIFSLKTNNLSSSILSRVKNIEGVIGCSSTKGLYFGCCFYMKGTRECDYYRGCSVYDLSFRHSQNFKIDEYEVFQILKRD
ncbi:hypothetical protein C2G38_2172969 [Gigaspora rosea]|uniref:TLD-domain-containing protein n=1 Tax=Gigaspora rosea TaxID=44941 RepID=A0A397VLV5_9GLOM|nr:hypothetical protein C2G38_2172969 [Gigaspora rosea]